MEISAGVILFRKEEKHIKYLLLQYSANHWDFPKGHIEKGESLKQTALRELKEETGISDVKIIDNFKEEISYFFKKEGKTISKKVVFFLAETKQSDAKLSSEHIDYKWLPYESAVKQATFKNAKQVLEKANKFIIVNLKNK